MDSQKLSRLCKQIRQHTKPIDLYDLFSDHEDRQFSCYAGLIAIVYNMSLRQQTLSLLELKGSVLAELSKLLHLPAPASYLASFDFTAFQQACHQQQELKLLLKYSRGLYPQFQPNEHEILQFYPFYRRLKNSSKDCSFRLGNKLWRLTTNIVNQYYSTQKRQDGRVPWTNQPDSQKNGQHLSYILLLRLEDDFSSYIGLLSPAQQQRAAYLKNWFSNYVDFVEEGIKMYNNQLESSDVSLVRQGSFVNFSDALQIKILDIIMRLSRNKQAHVSSGIAEIVQMIHVLPQPEQQRCFLLTIMHKIESALSRQYSHSKQMYRQHYQNTSLYNRLFYTDREIVEAYKNGDLTSLSISSYQAPLKKAIYMVSLAVNPLISLNPPEDMQAHISETELIKAMLQSNSIGSRLWSSQVKQTLGQFLISHLEGLLMSASKDQGIENLQQQSRPILAAWKNYHTVLDMQSVRAISHLLNPQVINIFVDSQDALINIVDLVNKQLFAQGQLTSEEQHYLIQVLKNPLFINKIIENPKLPSQMKNEHINSLARFLLLKPQFLEGVQ